MSKQNNKQITINDQQQGSGKIKEKVKKLPLKPGVYQFIGSGAEILYVGRATKLRQRISQYFNPSTGSGRDVRIQEMVSLAKDVKYIETDSVLEAVILEANLIKKYWPKYNVKDRDDRSFIYVAISRIDDFPKPIIIRGRQLKNYDLRLMSNYIFGPYQSQTLVSNALRIIRKIFPYSTCNPGQGKPCFNYQIGLCPGACIGAISKKDYQKNIRGIVLLLKGEKEKLLEKLKKENPEKIKSLKHIQDVALVSESNGQMSNVNGQMFRRIEGYDISHLSGKETYGSMVVFENNEPNKNEYRLFKIKEAPASDDLKALGEVIERRFKHKEWKFPDLIMIDGGIPQIRHISQVLHKINIFIPVVGISKYGGDQLVFPLETNKVAREKIESLKNILLKVRDEAHRFALKSSRRKRKIKEI